MAGQTLGGFLRSAREALGLSLREVEHKTHRHIKNAYLSQIENGQIEQPSPAILWQLAEVYGLDYGDLMRRAGHRVPRDQKFRKERAPAGIPLRAIAELDEEDQQLLREYIAFLQHRRRGRGSSHGSDRGP
jgi:transcriptional regulator with XRE-family HTH domain